MRQACRLRSSFVLNNSLPVSYTHLTEDEKLIDQKRHEIAQNLIKNFVTEMMTIGFSSPKIKTIITDYIEQTGKEL